MKPRDNSLSTVTRSRGEELGVFSENLLKTFIFGDEAGRFILLKHVNELHYDDDEVIT